jgi:hypothetical protein
VPFKKLNILQIASALDMSDSVLGYFLKDHQLFNQLNQKKNLPPIALLYNDYGNFIQNSSLFLRILISWGRITTLNSIMEGTKNIWTLHNIIHMT